jgi:hypothetical protein
MKLKQSKEGAVQKVTGEFNDQIAKLEAKYQKEIKQKEEEITKLQQRTQQLEQQLQ